MVSRRGFLKGLGAAASQGTKKAAKETVKSANPIQKISGVKRAAERAVDLGKVGGKTTTRRKVLKGMLNEGKRQYMKKPIGNSKKIVGAMKDGLDPVSAVKNDALKNGNRLTRIVGKFLSPIS